MQAKKRSGTRSAAKSTSKPLEPVTFFVDESLDSLSVVSALRDAGASVQRLTDHFPKGTPDEVWLAEAGRNGWVVLTRDKRIRILAGSLERITKIARTDAGPFIYHIGRSGRPIRMD